MRGQIKKRSVKKASWWCQVVSVVTLDIERLQGTGGGAAAVIPREALVPVL